MSTKLGLRENWQQFSLLVLVNAFVGGMVGMERSIIPQFAEREFGMASKTAILSFITAFGLTKAFANYYAGRLSNAYGRKKILIGGWILALPIPFLLIYAPSWNWVIFANVLLGTSQGFTWSSTVIMKIDLVGEKDRGLAMGLNEFAGYAAVGLVTFLTAWIAAEYGIRPYPFYLGIVMAVLGLAISIIWVKDTGGHVRAESQQSTQTNLTHVFWETTLKNKTLSSVTQSGLVNNLNDGMIWGLLPIVLVSLDFSTEQVGALAAVYPTVWGISQIFTGKISDHVSKKRMLFWGMLLQGTAILFIPMSESLIALTGLSVILGIGTAMVYPTFLATIAQVTHPTQRAESIGTFRLWRDLGYAFGAILSGLTADAFGLDAAIVLIGAITIASALVIQMRMEDG
jgi:MFS family permease